MTMVVTLLKIENTALFLPDTYITEVLKQYRILYSKVGLLSNPVILQPCVMPAMSFATLSKADMIQRA